MKKKMALLLAAALTMTTILTGCGGGNEENADKQSDVTAEDAKEENASGDSVSEGGTVFTVGFDAEYPPYGYMDENGEYTGFDLELAQAVCDLEGWELVKKPINWDSKDMELNSGSIDCIWNGFTMNGREDDYTFSDSYVDNSQVIVVAEDSGIDTLDALAGKVVGVQAASAALEARPANRVRRITPPVAGSTRWMPVVRGAAERTARTAPTAATAAWTSCASEERPAARLPAPRRFRGSGVPLPGLSATGRGAG